MAKAGDVPARAWLAQYLMGKPQGSAPTPLTVVVSQLVGGDPVVDSLASPLINRKKFPSLYADDHNWEDDLRAQVAAEVAAKVLSPDCASPQTAK